MTELPTAFRPETAVWLLVCCGLLVGIGLETDWGRRLTLPFPDSGPAATSYTPPTLTAPFRLPSLDNFPETQLRPIFVPERRFSPMSSPSSMNTLKDQLVLTGTTLTPEGRFAFLIDRTNNKGRVVGEGKEINGVRIKEVAEGRVVLVHHGRTETLELKPAKPTLPDIAPAATDAPVTPSEQHASPPNIANPEGGAEPPRRP